MRILIVDDNPTNVVIVEQILKKAGYSDLITASSAKELFSHLEMDKEVTSQPEVDLILMDMMMPEIDGIEACRHIQLFDHLKDIPIIMVTAVGDSKKLAESLDAGAIDYVTKPIIRIELLARIRVALRLKKEKDLHKERDRKLQNELELATLVQSSVLSMPIENDRIKITAAYKPSSELAGDLYAWYQIDEHRYGVILLDVMGHGISSSLVSMYISSILKETITRISDPVEVIVELNRYMNQLYIKEKLIQYYFTAIYLLIDTHNKTIEYVNAGHPPGLLLYTDGSVRSLESGSSAVGFFPHIDVEKKLVNYKDDTKIILFTDGLLETIDPEYDKKMKRFIEEFSKREDHDLMTIMDQLVTESESVIREDDMCLLLISCE